MAVPSPPYSIMYAPQKDSPSTSLTNSIGTGDIILYVAAPQILPEPPFPLTLGFDKELTEVVLVTAKNSGGMLNVVRGPSPMSWAVGTNVARVFNSSDLEAIQSNINTLYDQSVTNMGTITSAISTVEGKITDETFRATTEEQRLASNKIERTELPDPIMVADPNTNLISANQTSVSFGYDLYDTALKTSQHKNEIFPIVSTTSQGVMTPEVYNEVVQLRQDVDSIVNQGGRFVGTSYPSKYLMDAAYPYPSTWAVGDFTYVLDDETQSDATTRYIYDGTRFQFAYVINYDPVGIATAAEPGLVRSNSGATNGRIFVESNGEMSLIGWDAINNKVNSIPAIGNGQVTLINPLTGATIGSFTMNQTGNTQINLPMSTANNPAISIAAGTASTVIGEFTLNQSSAETIVIPVGSTSGAGLIKSNSSTAGRVSIDGPTGEGVVNGWATKADLTSPTFSGAPRLSSSPAVTSHQFRNIYAGTADMVPGTTPLITGEVYFVYE